MENKEGKIHWGGRGRRFFSRIAEKDWEFGVNIVNAIERGICFRSGNNKAFGLKRLII